MNAIGTQFRDLINWGRLAVYRDTVAEKREEGERVSSRFSLGVENKRVDAERDSRTCLARSTFHACTGTGKMDFPYSAGNKQDKQPYTG